LGVYLPTIHYCLRTYPKRGAKSHFLDRFLGLCPNTLPTEVEREYACRAGTSTPFHFGEMIITDLANYDSNSTYNNGPKGIKRGETTDVGSFPANAWGLYNLHSNVWKLRH